MIAIVKNIVIENFYNVIVTLVTTGFSSVVVQWLQLFSGVSTGFTKRLTFQCLGTGTCNVTIMKPINKLFFMVFFHSFLKMHDIVWTTAINWCNKIIGS